MTVGELLSKLTEYGTPSALTVEICGFYRDRKVIHFERDQQHAVPSLFMGMEVDGVFAVGEDHFIIDVVVE